MSIQDNQVQSLETLMEMEWLQLHDWDLNVNGHSCCPKRFALLCNGYMKHQKLFLFAFVHKTTLNKFLMYM